MKRLSITELQRSVGDVSNAIIRGESVILTRNGEDFAKMSPIEKPTAIISKVAESRVQPEPTTETLAERLKRRAQENEGNY